MVGYTQIKVSKLDAARRQLETAIRLYFSEADPISIHALMSAAYQGVNGHKRCAGRYAYVEGTAAKLGESRRP